MLNNVLAIQKMVDLNLYIDWEWVLEYNYRTLLSGIEPLVIIDIGGSVGRHSRVFVDQMACDQLVVFEPIPHLNEDLTAMFVGKPVTVISYALGAKEGSSSFFIKPTAIGESGLRKRSFYNDGREDNLDEIVVEVKRLDSIALPRRPVSFIKIDTEGGEIDILKGAEQLLLRDRPVLSVEFGRGGYDAFGYGPSALFELGTSLGYGLFDLVGTEFKTESEWLNGVDRLYWDYLLLPVERRDFFLPRMNFIRSSVIEVIKTGQQNAASSP